MSVTISRILHAGYIFAHEHTQIAFDPILQNPFSRNCHAFPSVKFDDDQIRKLNLSAVFISHYHDDHCCFDSLNLLDRKTPIYIYCIFDEMISMIKQLGFVNVHALEIDVAVVVGSIEVIPRRALDADVDSLFQVKAAGLNVLNVVDSWIDDETLLQLKDAGPWDMVLWPFQTMREIEVIAPSRSSVASEGLPQEWVEQLKVLNPKFAVPSSCQFIQESWSWYNHAFFPISYNQFTQQLKSFLPASEVIRLNPSVSIILSKDTVEVGTPLPWIQPIGKQDVDYEYDKNIKPPATADIAKNFAELNTKQTAKVYEYCLAGLIDKYSSMDPPTESYFKKNRLWRLTVYDHKGTAGHFYYILNGNHIRFATEDEQPLAWTTEVPISKLYAALELGESLTSMYMRINDVVFQGEIEKELEAVDIVEDPLIRCLFNGAFGAYQLAQLKRIQGQAG